MYPLHQLVNELRQAKTKLQDSFKPSEPANIVPVRSPKTSIILAFARWQKQRAMVQKAFRSIALLAAKAHNTEQQWVLRLISEIEAEIDRIKNALSDCGVEWKD